MTESKMNKWAVAYYRLVHLIMYDEEQSGECAPGLILSPQEARKLAAELLLAAKECEERESNETD
jgi:hypothetical protein